MEMTTIRDDSGVVALASLFAMHRIAADPAQLRHSLGHGRPIDAVDLVRLARRFDGVRAKSIVADWAKLRRLPLPALARGVEGWFLIGKIVGDEALIQMPGKPIARLSRDDLAMLWPGEIVLLTTRENTGLTNRPVNLAWFMPQIARYRRLIGEVLLITLAINLLGLAAPLFFQNVVDKVLAHDTLSTLTVLVIGFAGVSLWETAFGWLRTKIHSETGQKIDVELGARLFRHLLALPLSYFEARRVGDTAMRVRQIETIREFITSASLSILIDPLFAIVFLGAIALYSIPLFLVCVVTLPLYVLVALAVTGAMRARLDEKFERGASNNALLIETISGIQTIKAAAVEPQWQDRWERQLAGYSDACQRVVDLGNSGGQAIQLISKLSMAAILYVGARSVIDHTLTVGGLIAVNMFAQRVSGPVIKLAQLWQDFQQVRIALRRLGDVLDQPSEAGGSSGASLPELAGAIRFESVRFRYAADGPWTLEDIDLDVPAGTTIGIVGSSGSGKSTLTKLLQRLYTPAGGRLLIDGTDVAQIDPAWLRRRIGVVLQENMLFNRSVRENIALADPALPIEAVVEAAKLAGAHEFILRMSQGYDTPIEERGVNLSGGQRQRLAIARALVGKPAILIFDEATSALDAESEEIIQTNLKAMAAGRTVLIIAHRLSAIGRIVETGHHDDLVRRDGRYADLHRRQTGHRRKVSA